MAFEGKNVMLGMEAKLNGGHKKKDLEYFVPGLIFWINFGLAINDTINYQIAAFYIQLFMCP